MTKDLGVIFDTELTFRDHYDYIIAKSSAMLGFIKRTCKEMRNVYALKSIYCAMVRSRLEFAAVVWNPYYAIHCKRIESIQKKFLLYALRYLGWRNRRELPSYADRSKLIALESLEQRRRNASVNFVFDMLNGRIDAPVLLSRINFHCPRRNLRSRELLELDKHRTLYGNHEPITNMCRLFNRVQSVFDFNFSRNSFKRLCKGLTVS